MKFCMTHWSKLRDEVVRLGMEGLIASTGEDLIAKVGKELEDGASKTTFDPLFGAHNAIVAVALDTVGLAILADNDDGTDRCPLCYMQSLHDKDCPQAGCTFSFDGWISGAAKQMQEEAKRLGLIAAA